MKEPRKISLNVVFSPDAWQTLGRVSSEEFQTLQSVLRAELAGEVGRSAGEVRAGHLVATYEFDREQGAVTVVALARAPRAHSRHDPSSNSQNESSEL